MSDSMRDAMSDSMQDASRDDAPRVSYLDVVEQQLDAMKAQAQSTIAACESALVTVRLLKSQLDSARRLADERRQEAAAAPKRPATFGRHRRTQESTHGDE